MTRRILAITVAIVLAGLGTAGVLFYALTADARARARIEDPVTVAIAAKRISAGTTGERIRSENLVRLEKMPKSSVPSDALSEISSELDKLVVMSNVAAGQVLLAANFGDSTRATSGLPLPEGKMAVTVETGVPEQVAGYVQPGAQIVMFLTYDLLDSNGKKTGIQRTRVLLPRVEVLAVGTYQPNRNGTSTNSTTGGNRTTSSLLVTVAVDQQEAERLIEGQAHGSLYLGLLTDSVEVRTGTGVDNTDAGDGTVPLFR
jgi:pilus assembly protein CpaB